MATDNTVLNPGVGGDTMRDLARQGGSVKTQVIAIDVGGASTNAEVLLTAGQQLMGASIPVTLASDQSPLSVSTSAANDSWGQSLALTSSATATLVSIASSPVGYQIKGFVVHGTGDGYWTVQVASATVLSGRTRSTLPTLVVSLPNGIIVTTNSLVSLKVTNESGSTADYEATLLGA